MVKVGQYWRSIRGGHGRIIKILSIGEDYAKVYYVYQNTTINLPKEILLGGYKLDPTWNTKLRRVLND